jgi:hypothetical protein
MHGPAWRRANAGHVSLAQLKVMSSIEACRTEALGGHVAACTKCNHHHIAYNSCKNRHCPKCQGPAARDWMAARAEDLLPVEYFHLVFTLPAEIARIAYWNKKAVYGLLFRASAKTVATIAADPKRLGARIGMTSVAAHMGLCLGSSSSRPHDRAGRWLVERRQPLGRVQAGLLSACAGFIPTVSTLVCRRVAGSTL